MRPSARGRSVAVALAALTLSLAACGDDDADGDAAAKVEPTPLAITTSDAGPKRFQTEAPASIKGGLVELTFTNAGKGTHEAQLIRVDGEHTSKEVLDVVTAEQGAPRTGFMAPAAQAARAPARR